MAWKAPMSFFSKSKDPPPNEGWQGGGGLDSYPPQEKEHYSQLWQRVDSNNTGWIDGDTAANFLSTSGLPQATLMKIWEIVAPNGQGGLQAAGFFAACRLVAHAQSGTPPDYGVEQRAPNMLPHFEGVQRARHPGEVSPLGGSPRDDKSDISELQPVIMGGGDELDMARPHRGRSMSPRSPANDIPHTEERWAPSQREKRKYASLFKRTDLNHDGFVEGSEASDLLERSGLSPEMLSVMWEHSDVDRDGRLNWAEFVCLVHLVTCGLRGAEMPPIGGPLSPYLLQALNQLESPDQLVAEREASRSRSHSPAPGISTLQQDHMWESTSTGFNPPGGFNMNEPGPSDFGGPPGGTADFGGGFQDKPGGGFDGGFSTGGFNGGNMDSGFGDGLGLGGAFDDSAYEPDGKKGKKSKKDKKDKDDFGFGGGDRREEAFDTPPPSYKQTARPRYTGNGFEKVVNANRDITAKLRGEVDLMHQEMEDIHQMSGNVRSDIQELRKDEHTFQETRILKKVELDDIRGRLTSMREQRRALSALSLTLRRDHGHILQELEYLQRMTVDEEQTVMELRSSNGMMEKSCRGLQEHVDRLQEDHRLMAQNYQREVSAMREDERIVEDLKKKVQRAKHQAQSERRDDRRGGASRNIPSSTNVPNSFTGPVGDANPFNTSNANPFNTSNTLEVGGRAGVLRPPSSMGGAHDREGV